MSGAAGDGRHAKKQTATQTMARAVRSDIGKAASRTSTDLRHRSLLDHPPNFRPFRGTDLFERIGDRQTIDRLVDLLYDGLADDKNLRPLFPRDLADSRSMQKHFFAEWLDGPPFGTATNRMQA